MPRQVGTVPGLSLLEIRFRTSFRYPTPTNEYETARDATNTVIDLHENFTFFLFFFTPFSSEQLLHKTKMVYSFSCRKLWLCFFADLVSPPLLWIHIHKPIERPLHLFLVEMAVNVSLEILLAVLGAEMLITNRTDWTVVAVDVLLKHHHLFPFTFCTHIEEQSSREP